MTNPRYYRYDPFGRTLASGGSLAGVNAMRFSSKPAMGSSDLYYYGYRFYDPSSQRWLSRDPIEERGGIHLYAAIDNSALNRADADGLFQITAFVGKGAGIYLSFGYNSGQWNCAVKVGAGFRVGASFDATDSGLQKPGFGGSLGVAGAVGAGIIGAGGEAGVNGSGLYGNGSARIGHQVIGANGGINIPGDGTATPWATPMIGTANFGAAVFFGGGLTWASTPNNQGHSNLR